MEPDNHIIRFEHIYKLPGEPTINTKLKEDDTSSTPTNTNNDCCNKICDYFCYYFCFWGCLNI